MKKTVLMALLTIVMVGCKEDPKKDVVATAATDSDGICQTSLADYEKIPESESVRRAEWLISNGANVCKKVLYPYILEGHTLPNGDYDTLKSEYGEQTPLKMKWKDINKKIGTHFYDKYIGFEINGSKIDSIKLVDKFNPKGGTYSIPLFLAIANNLNLVPEDEKTEFEFIQTKDEKSPVIFKVVDQNGMELNYSTKPKNNDFISPK